MCPPEQILHVAANLDGYGLTRQLELLVTAQLAAGQNVRVVALAATRESVATFEQLGVDCRVLDRRWRRDPFVAVRLAGELRQQSFDIVHLWGQSAIDYFRSIRRFVRQTSMQTAPMLTTLPHQNDSIAPGIALPNISSLSRSEFLAEQRLSEDSILIVVAGPMTRAQCIDEAIWDFELVRTLDEKVRLLVFGDGPDRHRFERFARLTSEPSAIRFLGYRPDFRELLPFADLFWHTAVADEALPLTVLEAMAAGVPVVANEGPGCRRIINNGIDDGSNGHLVPNNDRTVFARHTRRLMQDAQHADQLRANAAQTITERYSVEAMTQAYAERYTESLDSRVGSLAENH